MEELPSVSGSTGLRWVGPLEGMGNSGLGQGWLNSFGTEANVACGLVTYERNDFTQPSNTEHLLAVLKPMPIAVRSVDVVGVVVDFGMDLTVSQLFENRDSVVKEVFYLLPVDESKGVYRFEYKCYSPSVRSGPGSREGESFQTMSVKIAEGNYHSKQNEGDKSRVANSDFLKIRIGPFAPMTIIHVKIGFVQEIEEFRENEDQLMLISVPNILFPNYGFLGDGDCDGSGDFDPDKSLWGSLHNQYYALHAEYPVKIYFRVYQQFPCNFKPVSHLSPFRVQDIRGIRTTCEDDSWYQYCIQGVAVKSDVVNNVDIRVSPALELIRDSRLILEHHGNQSIASLSLSVTSEPVASAEVIFLMDQSGSMVGKPLTLAKSVLKEMLQELAKSTTFNVIGFGSDCELFFKESRSTADEGVLEQATTYIDNAAATLGRGDLLGALETSFRAFSASSASKIVIVISDGQMEGRHKVLPFARKLQKDLRIFSVAVAGNGGLADARNLKMLASAGGGSCEVVAKSSDASNCVKLVKSEITQSSTDIDSIIFSSCTDRPIYIPFLPMVILNDIDNCKIYCGRPSRIFAQFTQKEYPDSVATELNIKGDQDHGIKSFHVRAYKSPVNDLKETGASLMFHRLFAQRFIANTTSQLQELDKLTIKDDFAGSIEFVKHLSKTYNLMTPYSVMAFFVESKFLADKWAVDTRYDGSTNSFVAEASPQDSNPPAKKRRNASGSPPPIKELYNCEFSIPVIRDLMVERNASVLIGLQLPDGSFDLDHNFLSSVTMFNYLSQARPRRKFLTKEKWATSLAFVILSHNLGVLSTSAWRINQAAENCVTWMINNMTEMGISECIYSAFKVLWTFLTSESSIEPAAASTRNRQSYKRFYS